MLNIICIKTGMLEENCYIVHKNSKAVIIDPGSEAEKIINEIEKNKLEVVKILITHYHFDHIGALNDIDEKYNVGVIDYKNSGNIKLYDLEFKIIKNYGNTLDSVSFYFEEEKIMFSGDFIFKGSVGKCDIENAEIMLKSLKAFMNLPDDIKIYPGHGEATTTGDEFENNIYLRGI